MNSSLNTLAKGFLLVSMAGALVACGDSDNDSSSNNNSAEADRSFEVKVTNLTAGQPLSPTALVVHTSGYHVFSVGSVASEALEKLAEGGDNSDLITAADADSHVLSTTSAAGALAPGGSETFTLMVEGEMVSGALLSTVSMLVNTNDAITALNGVMLENLGAGESISFNTLSYDTGTEANTETAATIPGPAGGGEGFNATRDDLSDRVSMHSGVVSADDGLTGSALSEMHRWDNPVTQITITRTH